jgi:hypothetical protein
MVSGGPFKGLISRNDCIVTAIISLHKWWRKYGKIGLKTQKI